MAEILLVEDDASVREAVALALEGDGHRVRTAVSGDEALDRWRRERPDLILLDVMLPGTDGLEVCRQIRRDDQVPIIMLTARSDPIDVVLGLEAGADDYVTKPFEMKELAARIRAMLRRVRSENSGASRMELGGRVEIIPDEGVVRCEGEHVHLTRTEFRLLCELAASPGRLFSREVLLESVWGYDYVGDGSLVDAHIHRLRSKVERDPSNPQHVVTVRGLGYKAVR